VLPLSADANIYVGGPECGWCSAPHHEEKSLSLHPGDRAVVDKACSAMLTDQRDMDALVASWLPGSDGTGVADVLATASLVEKFTKIRTK
jgi:beta-glucosidase